MRPELVNLIVVVLSMSLGSAGAIMIFGIEKKAFWWAVLCVFLAAIGFELPRYFGVGLFTSSLISAAVAAAYADVMAHVLKVPATVMIIPGIIPAVIINGIHSLGTPYQSISNISCVFCKQIII